MKQHSNPFHGTDSNLKVRESQSFYHMLRLHKKEIDQREKRRKNNKLT